VSNWLRNSALAALLALGTAAWGDDDAIVIKAVRNPVDKSYRKMVQGMDLFEEKHALAPNAALRYKLLPRKRDTDMRDILVQIVGDSVLIPVNVAVDQTFTLPRDGKALRENATVRSDRRVDTMTWRTEVRTPGLGPDERRLGDLRLECLVGVEAGLISQYPSFIDRLVGFLTDFCNQGDVAPYLFFAERPLLGVTLEAGERRQALSVGHLYAGIPHGRTPKEIRQYCDCEVLLDRAYLLPLGDRSWPDDTRVRFEYMDAPAAEGPYAMFTGSSKQGIRAAFGQGVGVRFDNGYEVWSYDFGPPQNPRHLRDELVVLFSPSGVVANTRLRTAPAR
jgi:hypothetical protein